MYRFVRGFSSSPTGEGMFKFNTTEAQSIYNKVRVVIRRVADERRSASRSLSRVSAYDENVALNRINMYALQHRNRYNSKSPQLYTFITLAASSGKRNVTVWRPSVCLSVRLWIHILSKLNRARGANSTRLTRGQHATQPAYISARQ